LLKICQILSQIEKANETISELSAEKESSAKQLLSAKQELEQKSSTSARILEMQSKVETDLKKQVAELKGEHKSAMVGRQAESEMYEEAMMKTAKLENAVTEMNEKVKNKRMQIRSSILVRL
jgi:chromosome segregation ATPase